jgi:hypothetical protein
MRLVDRDDEDEGEDAVDVAAALASLRGRKPGPVPAAKQHSESRQGRSDRRWEKDCYMSSDVLAGNVAKRPRRGTSTAAPVPDDDVVAVCGPRPCDPGEETASRRRDKDRIPSSETYVPDVAAKKWVLAPRPILFQCGIFFSYTSVPTMQHELLKSMLADKTQPLSEDFLRTALVPRLKREAPVSLRLLDWMVVDYAPAHGVAYRYHVATIDRDVTVVMHALYTSWLKRWRRRHFDPFRRRHRIYFNMDGETHSTTVAQLHFFYMARLFGFLDYAVEHCDDITAHMKATQADAVSAKGSAKAKGERYRRQALVKAVVPRAFLSTGSFPLTFGASGDDEDDDEVDNADAVVDAAFLSTGF